MRLAAMAAAAAVGIGLLASGTSAEAAAVYTFNSAVGSFQITRSKPVDQNLLVSVADADACTATFGVCDGSIVFQPDKSTADRIDFGWATTDQLHHTYFYFFSAGALSTTGFYKSLYEPSTTLSVRISEAAVPEPAAWALMILGFAGVGAALRRRLAVA